jgi:hypothetical protein
MKKLSFKTHKIVKAGLIAVLIAFISSCDWIDPELNIDPDRPVDVPMSLLVPGIQQTMGFSLMGNSSVRTVDMWVQIFDGVSRQSHTEGKYTLTPADANDLWENLYTQILVDADILMKKAVEEESPHNEGLAKVMTAYALAIGTDLFGDMPYSEALRGTENILTPAYDSQQEIYNSIFSMLDEGVADLGSAEEPIGIIGDVIYGGDADAWIKAARAIKARAELQLSKRNGATAYANALALTDAFESSADDMEVPWETANNNPIYLFMQDRGDIRMSQTLLDEMEATSDPRIPYYFAEDAEGGISGSIPGSENENASGPGVFIAGQTTPSYMMTYTELKFIEAEAAFMTNDKPRAYAAFVEGVSASLEKVTGDVDADWMAANIDNISAGSLTLEDIIMQKRIATVGQVQPFSDWRRTGIPTLDLVIGATKTEIPRRYPYAQNAIIYNPDNVPSIGSIIVPVWWDE